MYISGDSLDYYAMYREGDKVTRDGGFGDVLFNPSYNLPIKEVFVGFQDWFVPEKFSHVKFKKCDYEHSERVLANFKVDFENNLALVFDMERVAFFSVPARQYDIVVVNLDEYDGDFYDDVQKYKCFFLNSIVLFDRAFKVSLNPNFSLILAAVKGKRFVNPKDYLTMMAKKDQISYDDMVRLTGHGDELIVSFSQPPVFGRYVENGHSVFLTFEQVSEEPKYLFGSETDCNLSYSVKKHYMLDELSLYLSSIEKESLKDLKDLTDPRFYDDKDNVERYLQHLGKKNYLDAEKIVIALHKALYRSKSPPKNIVIRGEGFGFLTYHINRMLKKIKVYSYDTSLSMVKVAGEMGIQVFCKPPSDDSPFDLEILMNVISMGILPTQKNCIVLDNDVHFFGSDSFVQKGALMCRGDYVLNTNISMGPRDNFIYSTPCHRGVIKVEQEDVIPRAINTIGASIVSDSMSIQDRGYQVSSDEPTVFFLSVNTDLKVPIPEDLPVYLPGIGDYLVSPKFLEDESNEPFVIGLPYGNYKFLSRTNFNDANVLSSFNYLGDKVFLNNLKIRKKTYKEYIAGERTFWFHYSPFLTYDSKMFFGYGEVREGIGDKYMEHNHNEDCDCFKVFKKDGRYRFIDRDKIVEGDTDLRKYKPLFVV